MLRWLLGLARGRHRASRARPEGSARTGKTLSWSQEAQLSALPPAARGAVPAGVLDPAGAAASAGAGSQAQGSASVVGVDAGSGSSRPAAGTEQTAELQALAKPTHELQRGLKTQELLQQVRDLGHYPKESAGVASQSGSWPRNSAEHGRQKSSRQSRRPSSRPCSRRRAMPEQQLASRRRRSLQTPWRGSQRRRRAGSTRTC